MESTDNREIPVFNPSKEQARSAPDNDGATGKEAAKRLFAIIGMGASAGGLEALVEFFHHVPEKSCMACVIITRTDPTRSSLLPELIQRRANITVVETKEGMIAESDTVYPPPSNRDLEGDSFRLKEQKRGSILRLAQKSRQSGKRSDNLIWPTFYPPFQTLIYIEILTICVFASGDPRFRMYTIERVDYGEDR